MKKIFWNYFLTLLPVLAFFPLKAQVIEDFQPSTVNQPGQAYPQVNSEGAAHEFHTWRRCLYAFAQLLFK